MARVYLQRRELPEDLRRLLEVTAAAAEYSPPLDIVDTGSAVEILMDVPGVPPADVDVTLSGNVVLIAGRKAPAACEHRDAAFHFAERAFGRFARAVGLEGAFDGGRATATLVSGELRVVIPRLQERRGAQIHIPIQ